MAQCTTCDTMRQTITSTLQCVEDISRLKSLFLFLGFFALHESQKVLIAALGVIIDDFHERVFGKPNHWADGTTIIE